MSITFPTFIDKEIPPPEKFNDFVQALEAKFAAGLGSAEISWPLQAGGDIDLGINGIVNGRYIWGVYNAAEYEDDFDAALVAGTNGCLFIPPNTTITMDGAAMGGSSLTIIGSGPTSILRLESGASGGWALRNTNTGFEFNMHNLTLDGQDVAANVGLSLRGCSRVEITDCFIKDFALAAIKLEYLSQQCTNVKITGNTFEGGSDHHIEGLGVDNCVIEGNIFQSASADCIDLSATSSDHYVKNVVVSENVFDGCTGTVINIQGYDSSFDSTRANIKVNDNIADNTNSLIVGTAAKRLQFVSVSDNIVPSSGDDALNICAKYGAVKGNVLPNATADGIDLHVSEDLMVQGNNLRDATAAGVRCTSALDCSVTNNECIDCGTNIVISTSATRPTYHYGNTDDTPEVPTVTMWHCDSASFVIPANTLRVGDILTIHAVWTDGAGGGTQGVQVDGNYVASYIGVGTDDEAGALATVNVLDATTIDALGSCWADGGSNGNNGGPLSTGHDLSTDWVVKVNGANIANESMFVQLHRGVSA